MQKLKALLVVCALATSLGVCTSKPAKLRQDGASFILSADGNDWFQTGSTSVSSNGHWFSSTNTASDLLRMTGKNESSGSDQFGEYTATWMAWEGYKDPNTPDPSIKLATVAYTYKSSPELFVFELVYSSGLASSAIPGSNNGTVSTFPSFVIETNNMERGWLTWAGNMASAIKIGVWAKDKVYGEADGGFPLVVFNKEMSTAAVLSPLNTFMSSNQMSLTDPNTKDQLITFGPMNTITSVPAGYSYKTIVVFGTSVLNAMHRYGELMRGYYNKRDNYRTTDFSINYLGYWTDNGACYYYNTSSQYDDYQQVLEAVKKNADEVSIPYRYVQLDSWWYYKGSGGGVSQWEARPDVFPNGIEAMVHSTGWRVVAHNRWWSPETPYAKQYKFIVEKNAALPIEAKFWDWLMSSSQMQWDLMVYEQDWLDVQFPRMTALLDTLGLGEMWLKQMGESAQRYGITIQYCMPWTRHVLQSVAIPVVTQIRVSDDYQPDNSQWVVGDSTILAHSVGLAAFKDNFRTSTDQPDCKKYGHMREDHPALETYAAALTAGPVGPSDMIGKENKTLIMATCMSDGRLLKPTSPAMSIDSTFIQRAFNTGGPQGQLWAAYTLIDGFSWHFVLGANLMDDYTLTASDLSPLHAVQQMMVAYQYSIQTGKVTKILFNVIGAKLTISKCGEDDFQYWGILTSVGNSNSRLLLGELHKIVAVSETRFTSIGSEEVVMSGVAGEVVAVTVAVKADLITVECTIGQDGTAVLVMGASDGPSPHCM